MLFKEFRELHAIVKELNCNKYEPQIEEWFPHMYADGRWAVTYCFDGNPTLERMEPILSYCLEHSLYAFFGNLNDDIGLFIQ
jgi:hypothetical protein